jgi:hypothetical protein
MATKEAQPKTVTKEAQPKTVPKVKTEEKKV